MFVYVGIIYHSIVFSQLGSGQDHNDPVNVGGQEMFENDNKKAKETEIN